MKKTALLQELKKLTNLGYIDQSQFNLIEKDYLPEDRKILSNQSLLIFALLGVVFIGGGIISIFAFNWSMIPREAKAILALIPLLSVQGLLCWKCKTNASVVWIQSLTLALGLSFLAALGLIYQAYQLSYSLTSLLLITFFLMLPIIYLLNAYSLSILMLLGLVLTAWFTNPTYLVVGTLLLPYFINRLRNRQNCQLLTLLFMTWSLLLPFAFRMEDSSLVVPFILTMLVFGIVGFERFKNGQNCRILTLLFMACSIVFPFAFQMTNSSLIAVLIILIFAIVDFEGTYKRAVRIILYSIAFMIASYNDSLLYSIELIGLIGEIHFTLPTILFIVLTVLIFVKQYTHYQNIHDTLDFTALSVLGSIILILFIDTDRETNLFMYSSILNLFILTVAISKVVLGLKFNNFSSSRRYAFILNAYVLLKIFSADVGLLPKGIGFIIIGSGFLVTNYLLVRRNKRNEAIKN